MRKRTTKNERIQAKIAANKKYWLRVQPICVFCLQRADSFSHCCHLVRRSERSSYLTNEQLQTARWNNRLGHPNCHEIYDNDPEMAKHLPGYPLILNILQAHVPDIYKKRIYL